MPINNENIDFLLETLDFYDKQYNEIADNCYNDVKRALTEIANQYLSHHNVKIVPFGSYALKSNYQILEPMEFLVVLPADRHSIAVKELEVKNLEKRNKRKRQSIKGIYNSIVGATQSDSVFANDIASIIMREMQKYLAGNDVVYFRKNTVFIKFKTHEDIEISAYIYVVYEFENKFENKDVYEYKRMGYLTVENASKILNNIMQKNAETSGNYIVLCKLVKMLELELIFADKLSSVYLSNKALFVENILYNVPNKFYMGDDYRQMFVNIVNYLKQCVESDILLADGGTMFKKIGYYSNNMYKSFVKKLIYLYNNTDVLIKEAIEQSSQNDDNLAENQNKQNQQENNKQIKKLGK